MPSGIYNHKNHPTIFQKGHIPWNKDKTKYKGLDKNLEELILVEKLKQKEIAEILCIPTSTVSYLRRRFSIRAIESWERWESKFLTKKQNDLIMGTLLGDAYARVGKGRHANITISQSIKEYTRWKYNILKPWCRSGIKKSKTQYIFCTISHPVFDKFFNMFYLNGRKEVTTRILNNLSDLSLAVWFMDDGTCCRSRYNGKLKNSIYFSYQLRTDGFSYKENILIRNWLNKKYDIKPTICMQRGNPYLSFNKANAEKLINIIRPHVIPELSYKIGN